MSVEAARECMYCGAVFMAPVKNFKRGYSKFCSRACAQKGRINVWSKEELALLFDLYADQSNGDIAALLGFPKKAVEVQAFRHALRKSDAFCFSHGRAFFALPADLQEVITLHRAIERKLRDVKNHR